MNGIFNHIKVIREQIENSARAVGRDPSEVELVAVSKTYPAELIREALDVGQVIFGESRAQELLTKVPLLPASVRWHFIGHLQRNKIRKVLPYADLIHSIDSVGLAEDIDRIGAELGIFPRVLLEVNLSGEATKFGFDAETIRREAKHLLSLPRLQLEGFMTMAPVAKDPENARPIFSRLRKFRDEIAAEHDTNLPVLSMGMSDDFRIAIEEGATLVRIGTAIFGPRPNA
ncbi:MAG TPA: YggS family pyridoxal phosphate-dependent enzyme [Terrimicrobiaceae bacterium]